MNDINTFINTYNRIHAGERVVVSDAFMDWADNQEEPHDIRTIPNPDRVGLLDAWVAFVEPLGNAE